MTGDERIPERLLADDFIGFGSNGKPWDKAVFLGDLVGYGANPNQVVDRIRRLRRKKILIRGNHDKVVCGLDSGGLFNPIALAAAQWTAERLTPRGRTKKISGHSLSLSAKLGLTHPTRTPSAMNGMSSSVGS